MVHIVEDLKLGGLEKVIEAIVTGLDKRKFKPEVWCLAKGGEIADQIVNKGVTVRILNLGNYYNLLNIWKLSHLLHETRADIVHTHAYFAGTFARPAAALAKIPVIINHVHTTGFQFKKRNCWIEKALSHFTDCIICVSEAVADFVVNFEGIDKSKTAVIYNGSEFKRNGTSCNQVTRETLGISKEDLVVITVASMVENKGHIFLLEAAKRTIIKYPQLKLIFVGDGPLKKEICRLIEKANLQDHVILTGKQKDVECYLNLADIFVLPTVSREGLGLALIEAMSSGIPLIATRLGGISEIVKDGVNGLLVKPANSVEIEKAIKCLIEEDQAMAKMGEAAKEEYNRKFTLERMISKIESLYGKLLQNKTGEIFQ